MGGTQEIIQRRQRMLGIYNAATAKLTWETSATTDCPDATRAVFRCEKPYPLMIKVLNSKDLSEE